jgi:prepilin-type N-terminal cleavage/methylation domain-containing protein/prepilin-type processing-associated H-X9-DG protein
MKCLWKGSARDGGQRTSTRPASRLAFTLIELLVVIAVIAILASLLLSAINRAKVQARIVACKSNLRQYVLGLRMYVDDYKAYPLSYAVDDSRLGLLTGYGAWFQLLRPYTKDTWTSNVDANGRPTQPEPPGIQVCPDYSQRGGEFFVPNSGIGSNGSYGYNCYGYDLGASPWLGLGYGGSLATPPDTPVREGDVVCPSDMIAVGDALMTIPPDGGVAGSCELCPTFLVQGFEDLMLASPPPPPYYAGFVFQRQRHGHRWNVVFCDGHVEGALTTRAFLDPHPDAVLQRWNRDHQPHGTNVDVLYYRRTVP